MNFSTYLQTILLRARPMERLRQIEHAQIGMLTELGELGDLIKREFAYGKEFDRINLMEECGDYLWYLVLYAFESGVSMDFLDKVASTVVELSQPVAESDSRLLRVLGQATGMMLAPPDVLALSAKSREELVESSLLIVVAFLTKYGFTIEQCLTANDAKLEARTGKRFDAGRILDRDTASERRVLEQHGKGEPQ